MRGRFENEDKALFLDANDNAIRRLGDDPDSIINRAELHRERGEFDVARKILFVVNSDEVRWVVEPMLSYCELRDTRPILLVSEGKELY